MNTIYWPVVGGPAEIEVIFESEQSFLGRAGYPDGTYEEYIFKKKYENQFWFTTIEAAKAYLDAKEASEKQSA